MITKTVKVLRGIPGSGKTHWTQAFERDLRARFAETAGPEQGPGRGPALFIVSSDILLAESRKYLYSGERVAEAHRACLRNFACLVQHERTTSAVIVVDNTNSRLLEAAPYMALAQAFGWEAELVEFLCPVEVALSRGLHGVPEETVRAMDLWIAAEQPPRWWPCCRVRTGAKSALEPEPLSSSSDGSGDGGKL